MYTLWMCLIINHDTIYEYLILYSLLRVSQDCIDCFICWNVKMARNGSKGALFNVFLMHFSYSFKSTSKLTEQLSCSSNIHKFQNLLLLFLKLLSLNFNINFHSFSQSSSTRIYQFFWSTLTVIFWAFNINFYEPNSLSNCQNMISEIFCIFLAHISMIFNYFWFKKQINSIFCPLSFFLVFAWIF